MEGYLLLLALVATAFAVYWSVGNDGRIAGKPVSGLFAYTPGREPKPVKPRPLVPAPPPIPQPNIRAED